MRKPVAPSLVANPSMGSQLADPPRVCARRLRLLLQLQNFALEFRFVRQGNSNRTGDSRFGGVPDHLRIAAQVCRGSTVAAVEGALANPRPHNHREHERHERRRRLRCPHIVAVLSYACDLVGFHL